MTRLQTAGWTYSIGVRQQPSISKAIADIGEHDWQPLDDDPLDGEAQIAETVLGERRLVVRRTRLLGAQAELWPDWRHFAFLTNRADSIELVEAEHRQHAVVELTIRDLKDQALAHFPSGKYMANAAWTVIAALAHNLLRWTHLLALPGQTVRTARTLRRRLLTIPGRLARSARTTTLRMPARWPWAHTTSSPPWPACARSHRPSDQRRTPRRSLTRHRRAAACPKACPAASQTPSTIAATRDRAAPRPHRPQQRPRQLDRPRHPDRNGGSRLS